MNNKYIRGSLCSIAPIVIRDTGYAWITSSIKDYSIVNFTTETTSLDLYQIRREYATYKLVLSKIDLSKKVDNLFNNKDDLCLSIFSKIWFLRNIFSLYDNSNGLQLLLRHKKLNIYAGYSQDIRVYKEVYNTTILKMLLHDLNKIISQSSKCIFEYKIRTFRKILQILMNTNINSQSMDKIHVTLINNTIFTKIYNKYIKSMNYYINLGELFKNV